MEGGVRKTSRIKFSVLVILCVQTKPRGWLVTETGAARTYLVPPVNLSIPEEATDSYSFRPKSKLSTLGGLIVRVQTPSPQSEPRWFTGV